MAVLPCPLRSGVCSQPLLAQHALEGYRSDGAGPLHSPSASSALPSKMRAASERVTCTPSARSSMRWRVRAKRHSAAGALDGLIVEGLRVIDGKSAAVQHRSRARELSADMRSGTMGMDEMRDAFGEVTWHQAQARRWRSENDS